MVWVLQMLLMGEQSGTNPGKDKWQRLSRSQMHPFFYLYLRTRLLILERGERREKERERETSIGCLSYTSQPRPKPTTQACALTGNQTRDLLVCGMMHNRLSCTGQGTDKYTCFCPSSPNSGNLSDMKTNRFAD